MANLTGSGSGSSSNAVEAGEAYVRITAKNDDMKKGLKESETKLNQFQKAAKVSFDQGSAGAKTFGAGLLNLASNAGTGAEQIRNLATGVLGAMGPMGGLAAAAIGIGAAFIEMGENAAVAAKKVEDLAKLKDGLKFIQENPLESNSFDSKYLDIRQRVADGSYGSFWARGRMWAAEHTLESFGGVNSADAQAMRERMAMDRITEEKDARSGLESDLQRVRDAKQRIEDAKVEFEEEVDRQIRMINEIADAIDDPGHTLNIQSQEQRWRQERGIMDGMIDPSHRDTWQKSLVPSLMFQGLQASIAGMQKMAGQGAAVMGGHYASSQTYADSLGNIQDKQSEFLRRIAEGVDRLVGKPSESHYDF